MTTSSTTTKTGYLAIRDLAAQALYEMEEQGSHKLQRAIYYAVQCVKKLSFITRLEVKTVRLKVEDNKTINLPCDCKKILKLGIQVQTSFGARVLTFAVNDNMPLGDNVDACGNPLGSASVEALCGCDSEFPAGGFWFNNYAHGQQVGRIFGYGGGRNKIGTYVLDQENDRIAFDSNMPYQWVYMEYQTNGINPSGQTYVHAMYEFCLITYIIWHLTKNPERQKKENEYFRELKDLRKLKLDFTYKEYLLSTRKSYGLAIKN